MQTEIKQNVPETALNTAEIIPVLEQLNTTAQEVLESLHECLDEERTPLKNKLNELKSRVAWNVDEYEKSDRFRLEWLLCSTPEDIKEIQDNYNRFKDHASNIDRIENMINTIQPHLSEQEVSETTLNTAEEVSIMEKLNSAAHEILDSLYEGLSREYADRRKHFDKIKEFVDTEISEYEIGADFHYNFVFGIKGLMEELDDEYGKTIHRIANINDIEDMINTIQPHLSEEEGGADSSGCDGVCLECPNLKDCSLEHEDDRQSYKIMAKTIKQEVLETALNTEEIAPVLEGLNSSTRDALKFLYQEFHIEGFEVINQLKKLEELARYTATVYENDGGLDFDKFERDIMECIGEIKRSEHRSLTYFFKIKQIKETINTIKPNLPKKEDDVNPSECDGLCLVCSHKEDCNRNCEVDWDRFPKSRLDASYHDR
jgi:hypothetical protein